jgi:hypothetical protein
MSSLHEFFVELDHETVKRLSVHALDQDRFVLETRLQFDRGWDSEAQKAELRDKIALARRLIDEGVPEHVVYDDLKMEAPPSRSIITVVSISIGIWLLIGVVMMWLLGWF